MKRFICLCLCCLLLTSSFFGHIKNKAYADPFTASQIASVSYAIMNSWGVSFTAGSATAGGMNNFLAGKVEDYVNSKGGSIADVFVGNIAVDVAGKLVVGQTIYNEVIGFVNYLSQIYDLSDVSTVLLEGTYQDIEMNKNIKDESHSQGQPAIPSGAGVLFWNWTSHTYQGQKTEGYDKAKLYNGGSLYPTGVLASGYVGTGNWYLSYANNVVYANVERLRWDVVPSRVFWGQYSLATQVSSLDNHLTCSLPQDWSQPTVLNPNQEWTGTIGGYSEPDTNLDQLLGDIDQAVADNNLVVDGEVIDIPIPPPTPVPIDPDLPLSNVPWEGLDTNLQNLYNQGLEEIGAIGDAQDAITDAVADQTGALEGAIAGNAGVVSGAIDQAVTDIQDAISEQTQTLSESASATAEATETIAEALEDEAIDWQKFDLRGLFPFCIPFDIYNMLQALDASPTAPHVQLPFVIESIGFSYTIDLDFSSFDTVAAVMRQMELIVYGIALAWATSKVIKW